LEKTQQALQIQAISPYFFPFLVEEKKEEAVVEAKNEEAKPATEEPAKETTAEAPKTEDKQSESQAAN
jgi:hypothetical protein